MRSFYNMSDTYLKKRIRQENRKRGIKFIGIFIAIFLLPIGILVADFHNIWANPERLVIWFFVYVILLFVLCAYLEIRYIPPYRRADHQYYHLSIKRDPDTGRWEFDPEQIVSAVTWDRNSGLSYSDKEDMENSSKKIMAVAMLQSSRIKKPGSGYMVYRKNLFWKSAFVRGEIIKRFIWKDRRRRIP